MPVNGAASGDAVASTPTEEGGSCDGNGAEEPPRPQQEPPQPKPEPQSQPHHQSQPQSQPQPRPESQPQPPPPPLPQAQPQSAVPAAAAAALKFQYHPQDYEREYYDQLFRHANQPAAAPDGPAGLLLPPALAAQLFLTAGIPPHRLRMIWNMAVMPARPPPPGAPPLPSMTPAQFRTCVRLIQLFQNQVTAEDEQLRVAEGTKMPPAYFAGVSGVAVPLPWNAIDDEDGEGEGGGEAAVADAAVKGRPRGPLPGTQGTPSTPPLASTFQVPLGDPLGRRRTPLAATQRPPPARADGAATVSLGEGPSSRGAVAADDGYAMSQTEAETYREAFSRYCVTDVPSDCSLPSRGSHDPSGAAAPPVPSRHVYVDAAFSLFVKSGLPRRVLGQLWDVVVADPNAGTLDEAEFVLLMHLVVCVTRRGRVAPEELPGPLRAWLRGARASANAGGGMPPRRPAGGGRPDPSAALRDGDAAAAAPVVPGRTPSPPPAVAGPVGEAEESAQSQLKRMERQIAVLEALVASLSTEVQGLRNAVHGGGPLPGGGGGEGPAFPVGAGIPRELSRVDRVNTIRWFVSYCMTEYANPCASFLALICIIHYQQGVVNNGSTSTGHVVPPKSRHGPVSLNDDSDDVSSISDNEPVFWEVDLFLPLSYQMFNRKLHTL